MDLWFVRYQLTPRRRLSAIARSGAREGALLRTDDGFADVHPWPELGDAPLDEQLALLARGETTALTAASLRLATLDGDARRRGVSLFDGLTIPQSHWPGDDPPEGFDTIKLKGAASLPPETVRVARTLPRERVDFLEDPCPYDEAAWRMLREETGLRLAFDRQPSAARPVCDVLVVKPALQTEWPAFDGEIVVTSYMDHAVGQFGAAYVAATHDVSDRCGLFTHVLYEPDPFIERVRAEGARLLPPAGTGLGFDELLEALPWRRLA
jgi:O-succinylbenzoate synthase